MFGIGSDGTQGLSGGTEENVVNSRFVLIGEGGNLLRHREDDVEILGIEKFGLPVFQPLRTSQRLAFRAVPVGTRVIRRALVAAGVTLLKMTAQSRGPAEFNGVHHASLPAREGSLVLLPVRRPVAAEDIRYFQPGTLHRPALRNAEAQRVEP